MSSNCRNKATQQTLLQRKNRDRAKKNIKKKLQKRNKNNKIKIYTNDKKIKF